MKTTLFSLLVLLVSVTSVTSIAGTGSPEPFLCENGSTGKYHYSVEFSHFGDSTRAVATHEEKVTEFAKKLGVVSETDSTHFQSVVMDSDGLCQVSESNRFSVRCHPYKKLGFVKEDGTKTSVDLTFLSVWTTTHIHETPFTTWKEVEVLVGAETQDNRYTSLRFRIEQPNCR